VHCTTNKYLNRSQTSTRFLVCKFTWIHTLHLVHKPKTSYILKQREYFAFSSLSLTLRFSSVDSVLRRCGLVGELKPRINAWSIPVQLKISTLICPAPSISRSAQDLSSHLPLPPPRRPPLATREILVVAATRASSHPPPYIAATGGDAGEACACPMDGDGGRFLSAGAVAWLRAGLVHGGPRAVGPVTGAAVHGCGCRSAAVGGYRRGASGVWPRRAGSGPKRAGAKATTRACWELGDGEKVVRLALLAVWYVSNVSIIFYTPCLFLHHLPTVSLHFVALLCIFRN
jgi:hypothetical protein